MKFLFEAFLILTITAPIFAQSNSAYTRKGVGDLVYSFSSRRLGMGQLGVAVPDEDFISTVNPASWYILKRTRAEFSIDYSGIFASDNSVKKFYTDANFNGVTLAFPVSSVYGISAALGIIPYSNVSYEVIEDVHSSSSVIGDYNSNSKGSGGISKMFVGGSYVLPGSIAAGATFDYYFGNLNYIETIKFVSSSNLQTIYRRKYSLRGIGGTFGAISPDFSAFFNTESITNFRLGVSLNVISPLSADTSLISSSNLDVDTLGSGSVKMDIPMRLNTGVSFNLEKVYLFSLDYLFQPWGNYKFDAKTSEELVDLHKISAGFEYRPARELGTSFWQQIILRAGLGYERSQYYLNGENIEQFSIFGGISVPFSLENTLDIGIQFAIRGTTESNLVKENMIKLNLGLSLGEIWFIREEK